MNLESKLIIKMINFRETKPKDYHCSCKYCDNLYKGELIKEDDSYYSARNRVGYSNLEKTKKHLDKGHWQGYSFIIENYSKEGDTVFDPMVGSGTAMIEALKLNRKAVGIELEYYDLCIDSCKSYNENNYKLYIGDARDKINDVKENFDLIVTGTVYNNNSDRPERKNLNGKDESFNYNKDLPNIAWLKDNDYYNELLGLYTKCVNKLKIGGYLVFIIKDPIRKKEPYLLHKNLGELIESTGKLKVEDVWIHRHYPGTLFMHTYPKRFPDVKIPLYQTMVVLKKIC